MMDTRSLSINLQNYYATTQSQNFLPHANLHSSASMGPHANNEIITRLPKGSCHSSELGGLPSPIVGTCAACQEPIHDQYFLKAADRLWHAPCLRCFVCAVQLEFQPSCFARDGAIFCRKDYKRIFGTRSCTFCGSNIEKNEVVMRVRSFIYHTQCFHCCCCQRVLQTGEYFGMLDSHIFCERDFLTLTQNGASGIPFASLMNASCSRRMEHESNVLANHEPDLTPGASLLSSSDSAKNCSMSSLTRTVSTSGQNSEILSASQISKVESIASQLHLLSHSAALSSNTATDSGVNNTASTNVSFPHALLQDEMALVSVASGHSVLPLNSTSHPSGFTASLLGTSAGMSVSTVPEMVSLTNAPNLSANEQLANIVAMSNGRFPPSNHSIPPNGQVHHPASSFFGPQPPPHLFFPHPASLGHPHHPHLSLSRSGVRGKKRRCENEFNEDMLYDPSVDDYCLGSPPRQKRMRTSFKHHQLRTMKAYFSLNHNPDPKDLKTLSEKTGLSKRVLQVWFQNARAKFRRSALRQENQQQGNSANAGGTDSAGTSAHGETAGSKSGGDSGGGEDETDGDNTCSLAPTEDGEMKLQHSSKTKRSGKHRRRSSAVSHENSGCDGLKDENEVDMKEKNCYYSFSTSDTGSSCDDLEDDQEDVDEMSDDEEEIEHTSERHISTVSYQHRQNCSSTPNSDFSLSPAHFPDFIAHQQPSAQQHLSQTLGRVAAMSMKIEPEQRK